MKCNNTLFHYYVRLHYVKKPFTVNRRTNNQIQKKVFIESKEELDFAVYTSYHCESGRNERFHRSRRRTIADILTSCD